MRITSSARNRLNDLKSPAGDEMGGMFRPSAFAGASGEVFLAPTLEQGQSIYKRLNLLTVSGHQLEQTIWTQWDFQNFDIEIGQSIFHGLGKNSGGRDSARLSGPFDS